MTRVMVIGIDALDWQLISRFESSLPHFRELRKATPPFQTTGIYPPDTPTVWASIYTGINPARHGIIFFLDPLEKISVLSYKDIDNTPIRGKTFWDIATEHGKRVCLLFPELGYPVWPVNGVMVGRSNQRYGRADPVQVFPPSYKEKHDLRAIRKVMTVPRKGSPSAYLEAQKRLIAAETRLGLELWRAERWDLFFLYSCALDWLGHNMWAYFDQTDPTYPGANPYQDVFLQFYQLYDQMVGQFMAAAGPDTAFMVVSDHGQGMRPRKFVNINELLRAKGLLVPHIRKASWRDSYYLLERAKGAVVNLVNRYGAGSLVMRMVHLFPRLRRMFTTPPTVDWQHTAAYVSDLSGIKAYPYAGIIINRERVREGAYEEVRQQLVEELSQLREPETGEEIVKWVRRREEVYSGEFLHRYPDILFHLRDDYGAGWSIYGPIVAPCRPHSIQPGSHRMDSLVLLLSCPFPWQPTALTMTPLDIAPTVLGLLGVNSGRAWEGKNLVRAETT